MSQKSSALTGLRRPRILIKTARALGKKYTRRKGLHGLVKETGKTTSLGLIEALKCQESAAEELRLLNNGTYRAQRHIQLLAALIAESGAL